MGTAAVIGSGIVGVQVARELQLKGELITLYDFQEPGLGTSFGNAGYIATDEIFPLAHSSILVSIPKMILDPLGPITINWKNLWELLPWLCKYLRACSGRNSLEGIETLASLQSRAKDAWLRVIQREKISNLIEDNGALKIFETNTGLKRTERERLIQKEHGINWLLESGAKAQMRVPELGPTVKHAVFYPDGMSTISPFEVTKKIFDNFIADGGEFIKERVEGLEVTGRPTVISGQVELEYDKAIVCAGYLSGRLLEPMGFKIPLVAERGYHTEMQYDVLSFNMPIGSYERGCYMTPMRSGLRIAGTSEIVSIENEPEEKWSRASILAKHAKELLPNVALKESSRWIGRRPTFPDFLPMLGAVPEQPGMFVACGHHHLGLTLSAITASLLGELVIGNKAIDRSDHLRINRFS